jgi:hypothetical protein
MSNLDINDWIFADDEEANMSIRAAVHYRLKGVASGDRVESAKPYTTYSTSPIHSMMMFPASRPFHLWEPG